MNIHQRERQRKRSNRLDPISAPHAGRAVPYLFASAGADLNFFDAVDAPGLDVEGRWQGDREAPPRGDADVAKPTVSTTGCSARSWAADEVYVGAAHGYNVAVVRSGGLGYAFTSDLPQQRMLDLLSTTFRSNPFRAPG